MDIFIIASGYEGTLIQIKDCDAVLYFIGYPQRAEEIISGSIRMTKYMLLLVTGMLCMGIATYTQPQASPANPPSTGAQEVSLQMDASIEAPTGAGNSFNKQQKWWNKVWPQPIGR